MGFAEPSLRTTPSASWARSLPETVAVAFFGSMAFTDRARLPPADARRKAVWASASNCETASAPRGAPQRDSATSAHNTDWRLSYRQGARFRERKGETRSVAFSSSVAAGRRRHLSDRACAPRLRNSVRQEDMFVERLRRIINMGSDFLKTTLRFPKAERR